MLLDTAGMLCLIHRTEPLHAAAVVAYQSAGVRVTHNYVLAEFVALAHVRGLPRVAALAFLAALTDDPTIDVVWVDERLHREAAALLDVRLDKAYSLCDAVSFVLMRRIGVRDALTTDRHFEQEGFQRLLMP